MRILQRLALKDGEAKDVEEGHFAVVYGTPEFEGKERVTHP